jgi:hypothetical protein
VNSIANISNVILNFPDLEITYDDVKKTIRKMNY